MTQEQKAKAYDEALEVAKNVLETDLHESGVWAIKKIFPELKESEDEKIRKGMIRFLNSEKAEGIFTYEARQSWIAHLEKQKEQKPLEWNEDIILKGIKEVGLTQYQINWLKNNVFPPKEEQKPAEWSEEDERMRINILNALTPHLVYSVGKGTYTGTSTYRYDDEIKWLKSLRPSSNPTEEQKPEVKHIGWVARDSEYNPYLGLGLVLFKGKPTRTDDCWTGVIDSQLPWESFPNLKWEDEPVEVEVELTIRKK